MGYEQNDRDTLASKGLTKGVEVKIYARDKNGKEALQHSGRIDDLTFDTSMGGSILTVTGRDHMGPIVDSDAMPSIAMRGVT